MAAAQGLGTALGVIAANEIQKYFHGDDVKKPASATDQDTPQYGGSTAAQEEPELKAYHEQMQHDAYNVAMMGGNHDPYDPSQYDFFDHDFESFDDHEAAGAHPADHRVAPAPTSAGAAARDAWLDAALVRAQMLSQADSVGKIGGAAEHSFWQRARTFGSETLDYIESDVADLWHHPLDAAANVIRGVDSLAALQTQLEFDPIGFMQTSSDIRAGVFAAASETWQDFSQGSIDQRIDMLARGAASGLEFGGTMLAGSALAAAGKVLSGAEVLGEGGLLSRVGFFGKGASGGLITPEEMARGTWRKVRLSQESYSAKSPNAANALKLKLSALEDAQRTAVKVESFASGKIRYYDAEKLARVSGPTRGASYVTGYDTKTGELSSWMENYDHSGSVVRIHPKMLNGESFVSPHFPSIHSELTFTDDEILRQFKF